MSLLELGAMGSKGTGQRFQGGGALYVVNNSSHYGDRQSKKHVS
jgi:hypothetical protein